VKVLFVCLGNICRSPTVEGVARALAQREAPHLDLAFDSAGTADYHSGKPPDARSIRAAAAGGFDIADLRARQVTQEDFQHFDLLLAMDEENLRDLRVIAPQGYEERAQLFLSYCAEAGCVAVPDPYYGGEEHFEQVLDLAQTGVRALLRTLDAKSPATPGQ